MAKKAAVGMFAVLLAALLIPIPNHLKDGGTVQYRAVLYSVEKLHKLNPPGSQSEYQMGTVVEILGIEVFNNTK